MMYKKTETKRESLGVPEDQSFCELQEAFSGMRTAPKMSGEGAASSQDSSHKGEPLSRSQEQSNRIIASLPVLHALDKVPASSKNGSFSFRGDSTARVEEMVSVFAQIAKETDEKSDQKL